MRAIRPTPKAPPTFLTDAKGDPIYEDSRLHARRWWPPHYTSATCFLWHIERGKTGKLMLVADAEKKRVPLTEGRARELMTYEPSPLIDLANYPEEWAWWRASGWGLCIQFHRWAADYVNNLPASTCTVIDADRRNGRGGWMIKGGSEEEKAAADPAWVRWALTELLHHCIHPRTPRTGDSGQLSDEQREAFIKEMRRKVAKLGIS